ncbi:WD repeat-containing protein 3 [Daktulosphaira vitifoliae]|uniref:WD repeat-containing protein 3 n=1 Tax=Daktulosphaira vitifoliae TaxID=58002 RepID=UPI0021AA9CD2|nr:WD repeat-containing protein 3 [Daktulosphaira vitifoliae]
MGLTKQYLRYAPLKNFNIICHPECNIVFVTFNNINDRYVAVGASENINIWDLRLSKLVMTIEDEDMRNNTSKKVNVVKLAVVAGGKQIAAGYSDGIVKTFDLNNGELISTFQGHRSAITALNYDANGHLLASGSKDTEAVVWDIVAERGLHRLCGHKGVITDVQFMNKYEIVLTSSKDTYIKFWDLTTGYCFKTLAGHITEVWSMNILRDNDFIVTGSNDAELRTWKVSKTDEDNKDIKIMELLSSDGLLDYASPIKCEKVGSLMREGPGRVVSSSTDSTNHIICCHGHGKLLELFIFTDNNEALDRFRNRQRKFRKKALKREENIDDVAFLNEKNPALQDTVRRLPAILTDYKIKSTNLTVNETHVKVVISLANNSIVLYSVPLKDSKEVKLIRQISLNGHRSNVKVLAFSSDNLAIFTGGSDSIKMWNRKTLNCIRTVKTSNAVQCMCIVSGDRHVLAGLDDGNLLVIDIAAGDIIEQIAAHTKDTKSIYLLPDELGCITGGGDSTVKLWQLELVNLPSTDRKVLSLLHTKTLELDENVQCAKVSPDNKLMAIALLDNTVKIFFMDTFKHFIDLYGHTLPVSDLDISYDSSIIITVSGDKTIRIWGLDYGDCHRRLTTDSALTSISFVSKTHQFFTTDKNGNVKHWDGDTFERILTLQGHRGESYNSSISSNGSYLVSCGQDNVVRLFEKTDEPLVLEDEREEERAQEDEKELATGEDTNVYGGPSVLSLPTKKTITSEKAAELLLECLNVIKEYKDTRAENQSKGVALPSLPLIMTAFNVKTTDEYLLEIIRRIRSSELEEVLLLIPFSSVCYFMESLIPLLNNMHHEIEPVIRSLIFIVQTLHKPLTSAKDMLPILRQLNSLAFKRTNDFRDLIGENLHSLMIINNTQEEEELVFNITQNLNKKRKRQKQKLLKSVVVSI